MALALGLSLPSVLWNLASSSPMPQGSLPSPLQEQTGDGKQVDRAEWP